MRNGMQQKDSKSKIVFEVLRDRILVNSLRPGDVLGEVALTEEFGVSRTPVREALQKLERLGLVEIRDGAGTFVTDVDQKNMRSAYEIRCALEKLALETCLDHIEEQELDRLEELFAGFLSQLEGGGRHVSFETMAFAEWELHDLIVERSENTLIAEAVESLTAVMRRYQVRYISGYLRAAREHLALIACMRARDVKGAQRIIDEHLQARISWNPPEDQSA